MATIVAAAGGGNWNSTGTWVGGVLPTAADDVQLNGTSGAVTITATAACRSLDCTGYTGTLTQNASVTLNIGDGTAGLGNIALKLVAGMTFTRGSGGVINFISSATSVTHTIATGGIGISSWTVNAPGATYQLLDANTTASTMTVTLTAGTLNTNGQTCTWGSFGSNNSNTRTLTLGSSAITIVGGGGNVWNTTTVTGLTVTANTATVTLSGSTATFGTGTFNYNGMSLVISGAAIATISGSATFANLTRTGTAATADGLTLGGTALTVTGTLTVNGNSAINRIWLRSTTSGTITTITAAAVSMSNVDIMDITGAGAASWNLAAITGGSGDCGGNTNITFTTAAPQTWSGTSGGNWSANAWSGRVPLPQDDVTINAAFSASQTIAADTPRLGKSIDWTGTTGSPTWALTTMISYQNFGSLTLTNGMSFNNTIAYNFMGRGASYTLTSAGATFGGAVTFLTPTGTYTLQDALTTAGALAVNAGSTLTTNNQTVTATTMTVQGTGAFWNVGNSVLNATGTASGSSVFLRTSGGTISAGTATFNITGATPNARNFSLTSTGLGSATLNYTVAGSPGSLTIFAPITLRTLNVSDASGPKALIFNAAQTHTFTNFNVTGTPGNLITITSSSAGSAAILSKTSGVVNCDYLSLQDSNATGGASWYCGYNTTRVSNVTGWMSMPWDPGRFFDFIN